MANNAYDAGTLVRIKAVFTVGGVATDPTAVTVKVSKPDGTTLAPTATKDSVGNYHADVDTTSGPQGVWSYEFIGTGAAQAASDLWFFVRVPF